MKLGVISMGCDKATVDSDNTVAEFNESNNIDILSTTVQKAVIDLVLYIVVSDMTACYLCQATHHGFLATPKHPRFDREIEERLKYGEKAVMGKPMREGGTAGAPEPEH